MWQDGQVGIVVKTSSGSVPKSGVTAVTANEIRVYHVSVLSGGTAGILKLYNGTNESSQLVLTLKCATVSASNLFDLGSSGYLFSDGCYALLDTNCTNAVFSFYGEGDAGVSSSSSSSSSSCRSSSSSSSSSSCRSSSSSSSSSSCRSSSSSCSSSSSSLSSSSCSSSSSSCRSSSSSCRSSSSSSANP